MRRRPALALLMLSVFAAVLAPLPASASTTISGVRVAAVTHTSFTVTLKSLGSGWKYRLYASTNRPDVYATNLSNGRAKHSTLASQPRMTIGGLGYTTRLYWFRVQATKGTSHRLSDQYTIGLQPSVPTGLTVTGNPAQGTSLTWNSGSATGFAIQRATDPAFTQNVATYSMRGLGHQFTPYGLVLGTPYYFRVRAINNGTASPYAAPVQAVAASNEQQVRVMTYNVMEGNVTSDAGGAVAPWSQRRGPAAALIKTAMPDVIAVQEAAYWVNGATSVSCPNVPPRQVDDLVSALGGSYRLAYTEYAPCRAPQGQSWMRGANYIVYNSATFDALGGWHFSIDSTGVHWAPYQVMQNKATGAKFLFVAPHLQVGSGSSYDQIREDQTNSVVSQATQYAAQNGNLPIVYAGDFNSHDGRNHAFDGPAIAMRAAHVADAEYVAQSVANHKYDSANDYYRTPPAYGHSIDHVYASPGVAVKSWRLLLNLSGGKFVGVIPSDHNPLVADVVYPY